MPSFDDELNELGDDGPDPGPPGPKVPELVGAGGQVSQLAANKPPSFDDELAGLEDPKPEPEPGWMRAMRATGLVRDPANADEARGLPSLAGAKNFTDKMELMGNHPWKAAGQEVASLAAPFAMGPAGKGLSAVSGAAQGFLGTYADTGDVNQAGKSAALGTVTGAAGDIAGEIALPLGNGIWSVADRLSRLPAIMKAGKWAGKAAGAAAGGAVGSAAGSGLGPLGAPLVAAGAAVGADAGGKLGQAALSGGIRAVGNAAGAVGDVVNDPTARAAALAATLSGGRQANAPTQGSPQQQAFSALESGRGNKLSDAALNALQNQPQALGEYTDRFAQAASSPEPGAVNDLISKLMDTDPKFRMGPLLELQRMTAQ